MKPEGRAIAVAELLRAGHSGQQVSKALKVADGGGSLAESMAALREPDDPYYLASLPQDPTPTYEREEK
jgi:hypothetical protein